MTNSFALPQGTELAGEYVIERMLGAGGFGITYLAREPRLARLVTIKEYFPVDFAARNPAEDVVPRSQGSVTDYEWGLKRFLDEARTLAKFKHPNICGVHRYFEARGTGYIVLEYEKGPSLKGWLKGLKRHPRQEELDRIVAPLLDALEVIHAADFLHRDIAPDNIIVREDGTPVLIDFGSARGEVAKHSKAVSALVKPGYSPYEQYATTGRQQGPWTDIYSLGATLYHAIAGKRPLEAPSRMVADDLKPVREVALASYRPDFLKAIDHALALDVAERPQSVAQWRKALFAEPKPKRARKVETAEPVAAVPPPPRASGEGARATGRSSAGAAAANVAAGAAEVAARAGGASQPRRSLLAEFRDGWRQGESSPQPVAAGPQAALPPMPEPARPAAVAVAPPPAALLEPLPPPREPVAAEAAKAAPPIASRTEKAPPRAIGRKAGVRWKSIAFKLAIGAAIAAFAVWVEQQLPVVHKEGGGTVLSQTGDQIPQGQLRGHRGAVIAVAFTGDGRNLVSTAEDANVRVWSAATRTLVRSWALETGPATALAVEGRRVLLGHRDGSASLWDIDAGSRIATLARPGEPAVAAVAAVAFTGDPSIVAVAQGRAVVVWDVRVPAIVTTLDEHQDAVSVFAVSSRKAVATGGAERTVRLWSLADQSLMRAWRGSEPLTAVAFSGDGRRLAAASLDGRIRITSTMTTRTHMSLRVSIGRVTTLAFAPSGDVLASAGEDGTLRLWDLKRGGRAVRSYQSHTGAIQAIGYAPDGRTIAAAGADGTVRMWDATLPKPGT